jgi:sulfur carrier protein
MKIEVKLYSTFRDSLPKESRDLPIKMDVKEETRVSEVLKLLNLPEGDPKVIVVSGRIVDERHVLKEGDTVHVFPPMSGG